MGFSEPSVAAHLGIPITSYQAFEAGQAEVPAALLAQLADLFKLSIFHFFRDAPFGEIEPGPRLAPESSAIFTVATDEDRVVCLVRDFRKLDRGKQQYVLLLARALVEDTKDE
jgi:transcriptional regulator with XRE-family HTH domain